MTVIRSPEPVSALESTPGRGGRQHKKLQQLVKSWAEGMGWRATLEAPAGSGSMDVLLAKKDVTIACEISIRTAVEHELGNLRKCLAAGFSHVVSVCETEPRVSAIEIAAREAIPAADHAKLRFLTADGLFAFVAEIDAKSRSTDTTVRGYRVKVGYRALGGTNATERRSAVAKIVANSLKRTATG